MERRLEEAMDVVCYLPNKEYRMLRGGGVNWPDVVLEFADRVGRRAVGGRTRVLLGARAIARADEALQWFLWIEPVEVRSMVMARAGGERWFKILARLRQGRTWAWGEYVTALQQIADRLNGGAPGR